MSSIFLYFIYAYFNSAFRWDSRDSALTCSTLAVLRSFIMLTRALLQPVSLPYMLLRAMP